MNEHLKPVMDGLREQLEEAEMQLAEAEIAKRQALANKAEAEAGIRAIERFSVSPQPERNAKQVVAKPVDHDASTEDGDSSTSQIMKFWDTQPALLATGDIVAGTGLTRKQVDSALFRMRREKNPRVAKGGVRGTYRRLRRTTASGRQDQPAEGIA